MVKKLTIKRRGFTYIYEDVPEFGCRHREIKIKKTDFGREYFSHGNKRNRNVKFPLLLTSSTQVLDLFSFFKKSKPSSADYSFLGTDMHSHLIPLIDDGARSMEDAISLVKGLVEIGYTKIITTPHIFNEHYPNTPERILGGLDQLKKALAEKRIAIEIEAAAEYFMDDVFEDRLSNDEPLMTFGKNNVLVEVSTMAASNNLLDLLFSLKTKGYQPILAHPERYIYYAEQFDIFERIKNMGCSLQVNLLSLAGHYGSVQRKLGVKLLKSGVVDYLGTDLHRERHLEKIISLYQDKRMNKLIKEVSLKNAEL